MPEAPAIEAAVHTSAVEVEQQLLACLLNDPSLIDDATVELPADESWRLADGRHQRLYPAIVKHCAEHRTLDGSILKHELDRAGLLEAVGGQAYVQGLYQMVPTGDVRRYARLIHELSVLRELRHAAIGIVRDIDGSADLPDEVIDRAQRRLSGVVAQRRHLDVENLTLAMQEVLSGLEEHGGVLPGLSTGLVSLDRQIGGLHGGELIVLAARPGMGKSAMAMNIAEHLALVEGVRPIMFSMEMSRQQLALRTLYSMAGVDSRAAGKHLDSSQVDALRKAASRLKGAQILADFTAAIRIGELQAKCRRLKANGGLDAVFVDYLQLAKGERGIGVARHEEVASVSRGLKSLALELDVPVIALCQLNRASEGRDDKRPRLADLRESGQIEQDADVVLLLNRPSRYKKDAPANLAEVIVAKQRSGPVGLVLLSFQEQWCRFSGWTQGGEAQPPRYDDQAETPFF